jgi:hypothetical protein
MQLENYVQFENGPRFARTANYKGCAIEVAVGWDVISDLCRIHSYVTKPGADRVKVAKGEAPTVNRAAWDFGFKAATDWIDKNA